MPEAFAMWDDLSDAELIGRILRGRVDAYAELVRRYQQTLFRYALAMVLDADDAADLTQESLVKAYTSLSRCQKPERFGAWVESILRNRCRDHLKNVRRRHVELTDSSACAPQSEAPDRQMENGQLAQRVRDALEQLPPAQREAFVLKHVEGHSYDELALRLGASVSALKMRVLRARTALQGLLEGVVD